MFLMHIISSPRDLVRPGSVSLTAPFHQHMFPCCVTLTLTRVSSRAHSRLGAGVRDPPSLTFVIPEPSPGHAMFIRLPQTAMQSVAPDECERCVRGAEQTVRTVWPTWYEITSNFPFCLG